MPRFAANLTMLFTERPLLERPAAARAAGFDAVEVLFPYEAEPGAWHAALRSAMMPLALFNTPVRDWAGGDRGAAAIPGHEAAFRTDFQRALRYAAVLEPKHIHIMSGIATGPEAMATFTENLRWAACAAPRQSLTIEPINQIDIPGYFLNDFDMAAKILNAVAAPNLALQFDAYHAHKITGDVTWTWAAHGARAVHVQIAAAEGRHAPGSGAIDYPAFFAQLDETGYDGHVSAEYLPAGRTEDGLGWLPMPGG